MKDKFLKYIKSGKKKPSKIEDSKKPKKSDIITKPLIEPSTHRVIICILLSAVMALLISPRLKIPELTYIPGDISKHNIKAPEDFSVEDKETTEIRIKEKTDSVLSVYDFNSMAEDELEKRVLASFSMGRKAFKNSREKELTPQNKSYVLFQKLLETNTSLKDFNLLAQRQFKKVIEDYLLELMIPFTQREVVLSKEHLFKERGHGIILRDVHSNEEVIVDDFSSIIDMKEAQALLKRDARTVLKKVRIDVRKTIISIGLEMIEPTITFNRVETTKRKTAAKKEISPLYYHVKKGEIIVREGARITKSTLVKLNAMTSLEKKQGVLWTLLGYFLLSFISLHILYRFSSANLGTRISTPLSRRDLVFLCVTFILSFLIIKFFAGSARTFSKAITVIPVDSYFYAIPFAFAAIVISTVLTPQLAALSAIIISMFACFLLDNRFVFFIYSFIGSLVASQEVVQSKERKTIIRAGLIVGVLNSAIILSLYLISGDIFRAEVFISLGFGLLSGLLSSILAIGVIPVIEIIFNYTTNIKLLELADLNQPGLRKLLIEAPGTYHHSILVGILSETAAEAINANSLLTRVSAYYHDIGKTRKPLYFVENLKGLENKHDKLLPSMSSLIISAHVKDGLETAKQYHLGKNIQDIILQHHGTSCMNYFYRKAIELNAEGNQPVSDKDFRYPGPKPQTKEAGIVMLADSVEASSKTLSDPTPSRIQGMVQQIINSIFADGQLDECELTLKDLHLIADSFNRVLNGIFHSRIEYPDSSEKESNGKSKSSDLDKKSAKTGQDQSALDQTNTERDLGRIGIKKSRNKYPPA